MILTKTPLRISFVGGGSDRPSFYTEEPGACVAAAIDKYVYVAVNPKYDGSIRAAYSITENVNSVDDVQHELIRETLRYFRRAGGIEIHSIADIPGGTGLGSSSAFTVGLLAALDGGRDARWAGSIASYIEIDRCAKPIGKQDQYTAAYGGVNLLGFTSKGVTVDPIACDLGALSAHCLLLDTGLSRQGDAGAVLSSQNWEHEDIRRLAALAAPFARALSDGDLAQCGAVMRDGWMIKSNYCRDEQISNLYLTGLSKGAWGGKLCGAGGGGFLLFLAPPERHQVIVQALGLRHVPIRVGVPGSEVIAS